jgi:hypothetical protein
MTSNGSESLHKVFKEAHGRSVCAIIIATYYKLLEWFNQRKLLARELAGIHQIFSNRVVTILEKRANKAMRHEVQIVDIDGGVYKVIAKNERVTKHGTQDRSYMVVLNPGRRPKCRCRKSHNTSIVYSHVLAVCAVRNYDLNEFTNPLYKVDVLMSTWGGHFEVFGREEDWAPYEGNKIIPNRTLIKKGKRKSKKYPMIMDVLEGRMGSRHCGSYGTIKHTTNQCSQSNMQAYM